MQKKTNHLVYFIFIILIGFSFKTVAQERIIEVNTIRNSNNTVDFFYVKNKPGSYTVKLKFNNVSNSDATEQIEVVKYDSGNLMTLVPLDIKKAISYSFSISYILGNFRPKVDSLFQYILPFKNGKNKTIFESFNMNEKYFGAEKPETWKSYYIESKTADTVYAMRKGIVVEIINEFVTDTLVKSTTKKNRIIIEHSDGTLASYKGFKLNTIRVKLGETVYPATPLGIVDQNRDKLHFFNFSVYYLGKDTFDRDPDATLKTAKSGYHYLTPYFYTKKGVVKIIPKNKYTADDNETIVTKEFTKKELKNRKEVQ
jgi:murein DD-endopeptidase MepM/ murein hydrolase activator NlpD